MTYEVKNAVITGTNLGVAYTGHGILSFAIRLDCGGSGQSFGNLCLDTVNPEHKNVADYSAPIRIATKLASSLLLGIDRVFNKDWEALKNTSCRTYATNADVKALGHFLEDKWLWFDNNEFLVTPLAGVQVHHLLSNGS